MNWEMKFYNEKSNTPYNPEIEWAKEHHFEIKEKMQVIIFMKFTEESYEDINEGYLYRMVVEGEEAKGLCSVLKVKYPSILGNEALNTMARNDFAYYSTNEPRKIQELIERIKSFLS